MIVVSDTTPLRYLAVLGHLELLTRLFGKLQPEAGHGILRHDDSVSSHSCSA